MDVQLIYIPCTCSLTWLCADAICPVLGESAVDVKQRAPSRGDAVGHGNENGGDVASSLSPPPQLPYQQKGAATFSKSDGRKLYERLLRRRPTGFSPGVRHHICTRHFPCSLSGCSPPRSGDQGGGGEVEMRGGRGGGAPKPLCFWCACSAQLRPQEVCKID